MKTVTACMVLASLIVVACGGVASTGTSGTGPDTAKDDTATDGGGGADASHPDATIISKDVACSASTSEGDACSTKGAFCLPAPCTDECQFCNSLNCNAGKWQRMEAFPAPQAYCASAECGSLTCGKGEFCIRTHSGPAGPPTTACAKLPTGCSDCTCAKASQCAGMQVTCVADPATQKPSLDCSTQ